ncbi:MAG: hypothetical protein OER88_11965 [Planctomycetota bacterium]|nr:hypothetical protein [Planctomycetota bacterium]
MMILGGGGGMKFEFGTEFVFAITQNDPNLKVEAPAEIAARLR